MLQSAFRRKIYNLYNSIPDFLKSPLSHAGRLIPSKYIYGRQFSETRNFLQETEYRSKSYFDNLQFSALRRILMHAFKTTDFYKKQMLKNGVNQNSINDDPKGSVEKLGFIDKRIMSNRLNEFLSRKGRLIPHDYISTGGTSGEPFYFYIDSDRSAKEWAFILDQWSRIGFSKFSKRIVFRGSKIRAKGWEDDWITKERKFSSFEMTDQYLEKIWPLLHEYKPDFIYAYPSTALGLCKFIESKRQQLPKSIKGFLLGSENIFDGQREYIENITKKKVFLWYGHSEKLVLAGECEKTQYYHAYPQYGYVEFITENGTKAKPGEFAEIVGTGFLNTVMPFIRYKTGDYCTYLGEHCSACGRNYPIFSNVRGRWTQEVLYGAKRNSICMSAINLHSNAMKNVFRFQFFQNEPGKALLKIMPKDGFSNKDAEIIAKEFNEKFAGNIHVETNTVRDIPLTKMGKFKFIDQKINPPKETFLPQNQNNI
jgi:phenylacetate-CoA ligase